MPAARKKKQEPSGPFLKVPPHNLEAEQAILGGILLNNDALMQVIDGLSADDFYRDVHGVIFSCMMELFERGEPIDIVTLSQALTEKGRLEAAGGAAYLVNLADSVSTSAGIAFHAQIVRNLAVKRKLISQCATISESCFKEWERTEDLLEMAEQSIYDIAEKQIRGGLESIRDVLKTSMSRIEALTGSEGHITGVPTGFIDFDKKTSGLQPSDLIVLAGRPGMGKTALALNIVHHQILTLVADHEMICHPRQVGVTQIGQDHRLKAKLTGIFIGGEQILLERHLYAQVFVHSAIDRTHPTLTEDLDDSVTFMEQGTAFQCHRIYTWIEKDYINKSALRPETIRQLQFCKQPRGTGGDPQAEQQVAHIPKYQRYSVIARRKHQPQSNIDHPNPDHPYQIPKDALH